jgi:hypothetical protein
LLAGIAVAAVIEPYLDPAWFEALPRGLDVVILAFVGLPLYVCASGATPLAAVLLAKGVSPGAVLAFLITGPSANVTTLGVLARLHGRRLAAAFPAMVLGLSIAFGFVVNAFAGHAAALVPPAVFEHEPGVFASACGVLLALLMAFSVLRVGPRRFLGKLAGEYSLGHSHGAPEAERAEHGHSHDHACCEDAPARR